MAWSDLDSNKSSEAREQARERQVELAKAYARCFSTEDGQKVIEDLTNKFIFGNETSLSSQNINYESAYHNGESGVVKMIIHQMRMAQSL